MSEDVADVGQPDAGFVDAHRLAVAQDMGLMAGTARVTTVVWAWYLRMIQAMPPRLSLVPCWLSIAGWLSWPGASRRCSAR